jgi:hypothetical protein
VSIDNRIENGSLVVNSSMTGPALLVVGGYPGNNTFMTPDTILLNESFATIRDLDGSLVNSRMEEHQVSGTIDAFPQKMVGRIVIGQMAVNTLNGPVHTGLEPGFILIIHDMTGITEPGGRRPGNQFRCSNPQNNTGPQDNHHSNQQHFLSCHPKNPF